MKTGKKTKLKIKGIEFYSRKIEFYEMKKYEF